MNKIQAIQQSVLAIADYFEVSANDMLLLKGAKCGRLSNARCALVCHLYRNGMSYEAIAKWRGISASHVRQMVAKGHRVLVGPNRAMIEALPRIPCDKSARHLPA